MKHKENGIVLRVGDTEAREYNGRTFYSRALVLEQPSYDQYTGEKRASNYLEVVAQGDKCQSLNGWSEGDKATVEFVVSGSQYTGKQDGAQHIFMKLRLIELTKLGQDGRQHGAMSANKVTKVSELKPMDVPPYNPPSSGPGASDVEEDLPF